MTFDTFLPDGVSLPESVRGALHQAFEHLPGVRQAPAGLAGAAGRLRRGQDPPGRGHRQLQRRAGPAGDVRGRADLLDHLRAAFGPSSESGVDERLETIRETPLLILDDLGAHHSTPWAQEKLFQILNHRYNSRLPTVITTNQRLEELDPRIASRLADLDLSQIFEIPAPDFRQGGGGAGRAGPQRAQPQLARACTRIRPSRTSRLRRNEDMDAARQARTWQRAVNEARDFAEQPAGLAGAQRDLRLRQDAPGGRDREPPAGGRPAHADVRRRARPAGPPARHLQPDQRDHARPRLRAGQVRIAADSRRSGHGKRDAVGAREALPAAQPPLCRAAARP